LRLGDRFAENSREFFNAVIRLETKVLGKRVAPAYWNLCPKPGIEFREREYTRVLLVFLVFW
jgi:hypothetical protein